jgi:hypothetical protein
MKINPYKINARIDEPSGVISFSLHPTFQGLYMIFPYRLKANEKPVEAVDRFKNDLKKMIDKATLEITK